MNLSARPLLPRPVFTSSLFLLTVAAAVLAGGTALAESASQLKKKVNLALKEGRHDAAAQAVAELGQQNVRASVDALLNLGAKVEEDKVYRAIVAALEASTSEEATQALVRKVTGSGDIKARIVGCVACGRRTDKATLDALIEAADSRQGPLRRVAVRGLVWRRSKEGIPGLIAVLEKQEKKPGGGAGLIRRALRELTGKPYTDSFEWKAFWTAQGDTFELPSSRDAKKALAEVNKSQEGESQARFFGRELDSERIVFVIDISGSMLAKDPAKGGRQTTGDDPYATDSRVRLDRAKAELLRVLDALPKQASFTILGYSGYPPGQMPPGTDLPTEKTWLPNLGSRLMRATESNVKKAREFVTKLEAKGSTFTGRAIEQALTIKDADLIVLLSDGAPTEWDKDTRRGLSADQVRENIRTANRFNRVTINAFGFEGSGGGRFGMSNPASFVAFMKGVAQDSGGTYSAID